MYSMTSLSLPPSLLSLPLSPSPSLSPFPSLPLYLHLSPYHRCKWHEERENKYCSLGVVNSACYVLSDTLCPKYNIALTANHLPPQTNPQASEETYTPSYTSLPSRHKSSSLPPHPSLSPAQASGTGKPLSFVITLVLPHFVRGSKAFSRVYYTYMCVELIGGVLHSTVYLGMP